MKPFLLSIFCFIITQSFAQPVLTGANYNPVPGDIFYDHLCDTAGISVSMTGAGCIWNYAGLFVKQEDTTVVVLCSSTPYCDSFPAGCVAEVQKQRGITQYVMEAPGSYVMEGSNDRDVGYSRFTRPDTFLSFPATFGQSRTTIDNYHYDTTYAASNILDSNISLADGYGTLMTPAGTFTNVLRIHVIMYVTDSNHTHLPMTIYHSRNDYFFWFLPGFHTPILMIGTENDISTGAITTVSYAKYSTGPYLSSLGSDETRPNVIEVYPNPVVDEVDVDGITESTHYNLLDLAGRVVQHGNITSAQHVIDIKNIKKGSYILQLMNTSGEKNVVKRLVKE